MAPKRRNKKTHIIQNMPYYKIKKIKRFIQNYCKKEKTLLYDDTTDNYVVIKNKRLYIRDNDEEYVSTEIKFCPMCGDEL